MGFHGTMAWRDVDKAKEEREEEGSGEDKPHLLFREGDQSIGTGLSNCTER